MKAKVTREVTATGKSVYKMLDELDRAEAKVGWFPGDRYPDGTPVASVAEQNEYGDPSENIPARPFVSPTAKSKASEWGSHAARVIPAVLKGSEDVKSMLESVGLQAEKDIRETIARLWDPPLSPYTVAERARKQAEGATLAAGLDKPLIETGRMRDTLKTEVSTK